MCVLYICKGMLAISSTKISFEFEQHIMYFRNIFLIVIFIVYEDVHLCITYDKSILRYISMDVAHLSP